MSSGCSRICWAFVLLLPCCGAEPGPRSAPRPTPPPLAMTTPASSAPSRQLPVPTRKDDVVDDYFGTKVADPYQWLENGDSPEVQAWQDAQNGLTRRALDPIGGRAELEQHVKALLEVGVVSPPSVHTVRAGLRRY